MNEEKNKEDNFIEMLEEAVLRFGKGSQEGVKDMLKNCQENFACVSKTHQGQIGKAFNLEEKIVKTIIKFMPGIHESKTDHEVICCTGARCEKNGSFEVLKTVGEILDTDFNKNAKDGNISLRSRNCFKQCKLGPNIMIDGELHHQVDKEKAEKLLKKIT